MRACTWNIELGRRLEAVVDCVRQSRDFRDLDVLFLEEASVHDGLPDAARIAEAMGGSGYGSFQATAQVRRGLEQANALVWRRDAFQPGEPEVLSLGDPAFDRMTRAERALLRAAAPQRRIAIRAESPTLRVYVVHLDVIGFRHRIEQFGAVIADMATRPPVPLTLVAGDMNTFGPPALRLWRKLADAATAAGLVDVTSDLLSTHWTSQKLDAIFVQTQAEIKSRAWTLDVRASDHHPVFADIELVAGA